MAAIITEQFRRENAKFLLNSLKSPNDSYYLGIGQQQIWKDVVSGSPYPLGTAADEKRLKEQLSGLFKIKPGDTTLMIPFQQLAAGVTYKTYDPFDPTCFYEDPDTGYKPCYAMFGDQGAIYLCLAKESPSSQMTLSGVTNGFQDGPTPLIDYGFTEIDGHIWAYIGKYDRYNNINTSEFVALTEGFTETAQAGETTYANLTLNLGSAVQQNAYVKITSLIPGNTGNYYRISFNSAGSIGYDEDVNGEYTDITITYIENVSTVADVIAYIMALSTSNRKIKIESIGTDDLGLIDSVSANAIDNEPLIGGTSGLEYIKDATGGLIYGFKIINGGSGYSDSSSGATSGLITLSDIIVEIQGINHLDVYKTSLMKVDITYDAETEEITDIRPALSLGRLPYRTEESTIWDAQFSSFLSNAQQNTIYDYKTAKVKIVSTIVGDLDTHINTNLTVPSAVNDEASIILKIAPIEGFGSQKELTLPSWYVGAYSDTGIASYIPENTSFHQLSVIKNPLNLSNEKLSLAFCQPLSWFCLETINQTPGYNDPSPGDLIYQNDVLVGRLAHIQNIDAGVVLNPRRFYYYHDHDTNYKLIRKDAGTIKFGDVGNQITTNASPTEVFEELVLNNELNTINKSETDFYKKGTGIVIFEDNRSSVIRNEGQNEELKLIIQL